MREDGKTYLSISKEYLEEHYIKQNKGLKTIAHELGFKNKCVISSALKYHNIPIRKRTFRSQKILESWKNKAGHHTISMRYWFSVTSQAKKRQIDIDISVDDAYNKFVDQNGKCAISGMDIYFKTLGQKATEQTASLDRIDSSKGYTKDNIQWVHKYINIMKWDLSQKEFIEWCTLVCNYQGNK